jgi:hypothetical protein
MRAPTCVDLSHRVCGSCRHAPPAVLREAVAAALRVTHVHPTAIDGAFVIALAVGYLATHTPPSEPAAAVPATGGGGQAASVSGLFDHLLAQQSLLETPAMLQKLQAVRSAVLQVRGWALGKNGVQTTECEQLPLPPCLAPPTSTCRPRTHRITRIT